MTRHAWIGIIAVFVGIVVAGQVRAEDAKKSDIIIIMRDGKMIMKTADKAAPMDKAMTMADGTKVMPDGRLMKNGKTMKLIDGMGIETSGQMKLVDGIMMAGGKMVVMNDNNITPLNKEITLPNGAKIKPDGTMIIQLKDGMMMNMKGEALGGK